MPNDDYGVAERGCYFCAIFCYSGHLDFLVRLKGGAILCCFLLFSVFFWGRRPHHDYIYVFRSLNIRCPLPGVFVYEARFKGEIVLPGMVAKSLK